MECESGLYRRAYCIIGVGDWLCNGVCLVGPTGVRGNHHQGGLPLSLNLSLFSPFVPLFPFSYDPGTGSNLRVPAAFLLGDHLWIKKYVSEETKKRKAEKVKAKEKKDFEDYKKSPEFKSKRSS